MSDHLEIKADVSIDDAGTVTGIAWPFGSPDSVGDIIEKGAFAFATTMPMVMEHDQKQVIGIWETSTETDKGLEVKGRLFVEGIGPARDAHRDLKAGKIAGLSIGFRHNGFEPRAEGGRVFKSITVNEISLCRRPVHPGARVTVVKSLNEELKMENEITIEPELKAEPAITADELKAIMTRLDKVEAKASRPMSANGNQPIVGNDDTVKKAFGTYLRYGNQSPADELKALTVSSDPQGGIFAPAEMSSEFLRDLLLVSPVRSVASVRSTGAPSVIYPKRTAITNATWKGEGQAQTGSEPAFGQAEVIVREINTYVDISNQLLADSAGQAESEVRLALADDFGVKEGSAFVNGDGMLAPEGFMSNAEIAYTPSGNATLITTDALIAMAYAVPTTYRSAGTWGLNAKTLGIIRTLKDGQGNYLWQPSYQAGQPETILGRPVIELPDMPDAAANTFPIIFGDFAGYRIVDRLGLSILVNPYALATTGFTRIHATRRLGGAVVQAARFRKLKVATA
jgi:HK97 family phage major capsid protein/HK97 family phage prohead protease